MCEEEKAEKEDAEWARLARKSHIRWATENPYEDKTGNRPESLTITD